VEPISSEKNGVYFENGSWYYYENGKIGYNKGLIHVSTNWHFEDGSVMGYTAFIYVRSSGKLATGDYYVTNVSNGYGLFSAGQKVNFSEDGMAAAPKNGIYEIDGALYYFVNNQIQYNAGLVEYNGGWIYVRSNGALATGKYWITNTGGAMEAGYYEFGDDGYLIISDTEDGIVFEGENLYYYLDGKKQFGLGLTKLEDGTYIYVRTNGELAVGSYWITNHNGLLPEGMYEFGEDGILTEN
jgi:glucan-binding YG repeat protein